MDQTLRIEAPEAVRALIGRIMLGSESKESVLGSVRLQPHQTSVIARLTASLRENGGALLCDEVGMGKTFVALAVARQFERRVVVAPAALETMWRDALARAGMTAGFVSYERLSRGDPIFVMPDLLILDEAHHARNPATQRYQRIAQLAKSAPVLMLTATPVHNRRADLVALFSLFLGSRARGLSERELAGCIVRREREAQSLAGFPLVTPVVTLDVPDDPRVVNELMDLPPPLPARDAGSAATLISRGLVHQWASSEAALQSALGRRLALAIALRASLQSGRYPSATELETWMIGDGAVQLGLPELLSPPAADAATLLDSIAAHADAVDNLLKRCRTTSFIDDARASLLQRIRDECSESKIVVFAQYSATISELYRRLARKGRVAMLTASGAKVAGGKLSRQEAIERFAPTANRARPPARAEVIDVLLATDLLSEGVNLQDAEVVVHVDIPWTAARMEQRVGRVARMGSRHSRIKVYQLRPPRSAEQVLRGHVVIESKWELARGLIGAGVNPVSEDLIVDQSAKSIPSRVERLRVVLSEWSAAGSSTPQDTVILAATVRAQNDGFIAAGYLGNSPVLLCRIGSDVSTELDAQTRACLLALAPSADADTIDYDRARGLIQEWANARQASESAGVPVATPARRSRLLNRIDAAIQTAPPHVRASRARVVARARAVASAPHGAGLEHELETLSDSPLSDDDWLHALASLGPLRKLSREAEGADFKLHALLLFKV